MFQVIHAIQGRNLITFITVLCLAACSNDEATYSAESFGNNTNQNTAVTRPSNAVVLKRHDVTDPGLNNAVAISFLYPETWKVEGGMSRTAPQYYNIPVMMDVGFSASDGRKARVFPTFSFEFNYQRPAQNFSPTLDGNMYLPLPESPSAWLMSMAEQNPDPSISNLRVVSETQEPQLTQQLRQQNALSYQSVEQTNAIGWQTGFASEFDAQATVVVMRYTQNNIELEESVLIAWQYYINSINGQLTSGTWGIPLMYSIRGPVGSDYTNDPELAAIGNSFRANPAWSQEMAKYWQELARIKAKGAAEIRQQNWAAHQKRMQTLNETTDIIAGGWAARNAIRDAGHSNYVDSIHEVTPYTNSMGESVKLPSFYDNVYTDNNGRYILHNDAFYNPNTDPALNNQNWEKMSSQD